MAWVQGMGLGGRHGGLMQGPVDVIQTAVSWTLFCPELTMQGAVGLGPLVPDPGQLFSQVEMGGRREGSTLGHSAGGWASLARTHPWEAGPSLGANVRADWANAEDGDREAGAGRQWSGFL